ncbi:CHC2 zinc finger domain-containing protein [Moraxella haemolytica]|uniref:DNA primase n=1 Tax=Moraxella haemolytica TaxID=2904119 RepID=UPI002543D9D2|nr:CHC2 zinc finger domain-containing protein [Moraxella sp. ZY171148]WII96112.1 CHC2 zinc finger domain-containing protein [Moraxella sp. ZY171148]
MRIPESIIEQINSQADLVGMIRRHTTLKPAGREFKGCCPFHGEKTPSFYVNPESNLYYCFGCGAKGNPVTFLKDFERMSFMEAVNALSEQTGIDLPKDETFDQSIKYKKTNKKPAQTPSALPMPSGSMAILPSQPHEQALGVHDLSHRDDEFAWHDGQELHAMYEQYDPYQAHQSLNTPQETDEQGDLYILLGNICRYYQHQLHNTPSAMAYFASRGLSHETIATFELGYAPSGWQHLEENFPHDIEGLRLLGLVRTSQKGRDFNLLRDRVIFPIKDRQGRVVGFAGRSLGDEMPKYINSSESPVFQKQFVLYGLYEARQARANSYIMVEGYMDVIALHQAGIYGAVAPMGTAANEGQIASLLKYNDTLTMCFDGDGAGQRAAWRALEVAAPVLADGKQLKFLTLPDNHDPDTYIKAHGADAMKDEIDGAMSTSDYVFGVLSSRYDVRYPENKAAAMATLKELTAKFPKGSSFKWWLNNDIYQRLGAKKTGERQSIDKANYQHSTNDNLLLYLCLLYAPHIVADDPLTHILTQAGVIDVHVDFIDRLEQHQLHLPPLPTWRSLGDDTLTELTDIIMNLVKLSQRDIIRPLIPTADMHAINEQAHFIMASLSADTRELLANHWAEFFRQMGEQSHDGITALANELLSQMLMETFKQQHEQSKHIILSEIHKRRLLALNQWDKIQKDKLATALDKKSVSPC